MGEGNGLNRDRVDALLLEISGCEHNALGRWLSGRCVRNATAIRFILLTSSPSRFKHLDVLHAGSTRKC
jgi:hypothetical protein